MTVIDPRVTILPSYRLVATELTDEQLETLILAGEQESSPGYLLVLLQEWERRNKVAS